MEAVPCDLGVTRLGYRICLGVTVSCGSRLNPHTPLPQPSSLIPLSLKYLSRPVLRGLLCSSLGVCLYMFHDTVRLHLLYSLRDVIIYAL